MSGIELNVFGIHGLHSSDLPVSYRQVNVFRSMVPLAECFRFSMNLWNYILDGLPSKEVSQYQFSNNASDA